MAGQTLMTYAEKDGRRQIAVTMKSTQFTHYSDTISLMDFGFLRFQNVKIAENETGYTSGDTPVELGGAAALFSYTFNDRKVGEAYLISASKAEEEAAAAAAGVEESAKEASETDSAEEKPATGADAASGAKRGSSEVPIRISGKTALLTILFLVIAAAAGAGFWYVKKQREEERRKMEERKLRRKQRLEEMGVSQEDFERLREEMHNK